MSDILNYMDYTKETDQNLIAEYLKGDETAFEALIKRYLNLIYGYAFRFVKDQQTAEDITQDVFLKIWKNVKKVDKNKSFKAWIYTIAKNTALDFIKKKKAVPFSKFENELGQNMLVDKLADPSHLPDKIAEMSWNKNMFVEALKNLSFEYQLVLSLYYYQYLNFKEIAQVLGESVNTIKSRHRRGLVLLRKVIGDNAP